MKKIRKLVYGLGILSFLLIAIASINQMVLDRRMDNRILDPYKIFAYSKDRSVETQFDLALAYLEQGNLPRTLEYVRRAERMSENYKEKLIQFYFQKLQSDRSTHNQLGHAFSFYLNNLKPIAIGKLVRIQNQSTVAEALLAVNDFEKGRQKEAHQTLQKLVKQNPQQHYLKLLEAISASSSNTGSALLKLISYFFREPATLIFLLETKVLWGFLVFAITLLFFETAQSKRNLSIKFTSNNKIVFGLSLVSILLMMAWPSWIYSGFDANLRWYLVHNYHGFVWLSMWDGLRTPFQNWYHDFISRYLMGTPFLMHALPLLKHSINLILGYMLIRTIFKRTAPALFFGIFFISYFAVIESLLNFGGLRDPFFLMFFLSALLLITKYFKPLTSILLYFLATMSSEGAVPLALILGFFHSQHKKQKNSFKNLAASTLLYLIPYLLFIAGKKIIYNFNPSTSKTHIFSSVSDFVPSILKILSPFYKQEFSWLPSNPWPVFLTLGLLFVVYFYCRQEKDFSTIEKKSLLLKLAVITLPGFLLYATFDVTGKFGYLPSFFVLTATSIFLFICIKGIDQYFKNHMAQVHLHSFTFFILAWLSIISLSTFQETQKHYTASFIEAQILHRLINQPHSPIQKDSMVYFTNLYAFDYALVDFYSMPLSAAYPKVIQAGSNLDSHFFGPSQIPDISGYMIDSLREESLTKLMIVDIDWFNQKINYRNYFRCFLNGFYYEIDLNRKQIVRKQPISEFNLKVNGV